MKQFVEVLGGTEYDSHPSFYRVDPDAYRALAAKYAPLFADEEVRSIMLRGGGPDDELFADEYEEDYNEGEIVGEVFIYLNSALTPLVQADLDMRWRYHGLRLCSPDRGRMTAQHVWYNKDGMEELFVDFHIPLED